MIRQNLFKSTKKVTKIKMQALLGRRFRAKWAAYTTKGTHQVILMFLMPY